MSACHNYGSLPCLIFRMFPLENERIFMALTTRLPCSLPCARRPVLNYQSPLRSPSIPRKPASPCQICHTAQNTFPFRRAACSPHTVAPCRPWAVPFLFFLLQDPLLRYPDDHHATDADPGGIFSLLRPPPRHGRSSCRVGAFSDRCRSKGSRFTSMATIDPFLFKAKKTCPEPGLRAGIRTCCT